MKLADCEYFSQFRTFRAHMHQECSFLCQALASEKNFALSSYFIHIFEERKREYLQILAALGATKITIQAHTQDSAVAVNEQVFEFAGYPWSSTMKFDRSQYKWLSYDPNLQALVDGRLNYGLHTAKFEINPGQLHVSCINRT